MTAVAALPQGNAALFKDKASLEKQLKEVQLRCVDLETKGYSSASQDIKFLHKRVKEVGVLTLKYKYLMLILI